MFRRLFTLVSALSLLACVAVVSLWIRSYFTRDFLDLTIHSGPTTLRHFAFESEKSLVEVHWTHTRFIGYSADELQVIMDGFPGKLNWERTAAHIRYVPTGSIWLRMGFYSDHRQHEIYDLYHCTQDFHNVMVPDWALVVPTAICPGFWLVTFRRSRRRTELYCCTCCGYDLRATPYQCPECGRISDSCR